MLAFVVHVAGMVHGEAAASLEGTGPALAHGGSPVGRHARQGPGGLRLRNETRELRDLCERIGLDLSEGVQRVAETEAARAASAGESVA